MEEEELVVFDLLVSGLDGVSLGSFLDRDCVV